MRLKFNFKNFLTLFLVLTIILLGFSVFQISSLASESRMIQVYEDKLEAVNQKNETLIINSVRANSLDNIQKLTGTLGFERIRDVHHIRLLGDVVVTGY